MTFPFRCEMKSIPSSSESESEAEGGGMTGDWRGIQAALWL